MCGARCNDGCGVDTSTEFGKLLDEGIREDILRDRDRKSPTQGIEEDGYGVYVGEANY